MQTTCIGSDFPVITLITHQPRVSRALFLQNRTRVLIRDAGLRSDGEGDRREVDLPIEVESATWSPGGQLDWWVKGRQQWFDGYAVQTVGNGGSKLLIFVVLHRLERI